MSFRKQKSFLTLLLLAVFSMIFTLPGCKEGTSSSPVSSLLTGPNQTQVVVDLSETEDATHTIVGSVASQNNSESLANINVSLFLNKQLAATTKTTSDGKFYFSKLPAELYELAFSSDDGSYTAATYVLRVLDDGTTQPADPIIKLSATNPETQKIQAKIEGEIVLEGAGTKLANINIELIKPNGDLDSTALTSSSGQFSFANISATGTFAVKAGKASIYSETQQNIIIRDDGVVSPRYLIISLTQKPIENFSISGFVKNQFNASVVNVEVKIFEDAELTSEIGSTRTTGAGLFIFDSLKEAKIYFLKVMATSTTNQSDIYPIRVLSDGTTSPNEAEVFVSQSINTPTFEINGTAYDAFSGGPLEYASITLSNATNSITDKQGKFTAKDLIPGKYTLTVTKFGYEKTFGSFAINEDGTTTPSALSFPLMHSLKTGYGSIAGRYVDITSGNGVPNLYVRLYKWVSKTKNGTYAILDYTEADGTNHYKTVSVTETDYQYEDSVVLTSKSSSETGVGIVPEFTGSFKLTHLEPGKYLIYLTTSPTEPTKTSENRGGYFSWDVPNKAADTGFKTEIRALEVKDGQTTYWTNYEQEYK